MLKFLSITHQLQKLGNLPEFLVQKNVNFRPIRCDVGALHLHNCSIALHETANRFSAYLSRLTLIINESYLWFATDPSVDISFNLNFACQSYWHSIRLPNRLLGRPLYACRWDCAVSIPMKRIAKKRIKNSLSFGRCLQVFLFLPISIKSIDVFFLRNLCWAQNKLKIDWAFCSLMVISANDRFSSVY